MNLAPNPHYERCISWYVIVDRNASFIFSCPLASANRKRSSWESSGWRGRNVIWSTLITRQRGRGLACFEASFTAFKSTLERFDLGAGTVAALSLPGKSIFRLLGWTARPPRLCADASSCTGRLAIRLETRSEGIYSFDLNLY